MSEQADGGKAAENVDGRIGIKLADEIGRVLVGQEAMVTRLLIGLLCGGHVLLEGLPGLAKTLAVRSLARAIDTGFSRIQFTPDMLPADVIGTEVFNPRDGSYSVRDVLEAVEAASGSPLTIVEADRRAGDPPELVAVADRILDVLGWTPCLDNLDEIVRTSLAWERRIAAGDRSAYWAGSDHAVGC